jgi:hypothetical protein
LCFWASRFSLERKESAMMIFEQLVAGIIELLTGFLTGGITDLLSGLLGGLFGGLGG